MEAQNEDVTWKPEDAQGNEFSKEGFCPYWRCQSNVDFIGMMGYDGDDIVEVRYECENCGHTHEWAEDNKRNQTCNTGAVAWGQKR